VTKKEAKKEAEKRARKVSLIIFNTETYWGTYFDNIFRHILLWEVDE